MMTTTFQQWRLSGQQPHSSASSLSQRGGSSSEPASRTAGQKRTYVEVLSSEEVGSEEELGSDVVAAEDFGAASESASSDGVEVTGYSMSVDEFSERCRDALRDSR